MNHLFEPLANNINLYFLATTQKLDTKPSSGGFLPKRGTSFRHNIKTVSIFVNKGPTLSYKW